MKMTTPFADVQFTGFFRNRFGLWETTVEAESVNVDPDVQNGVSSARFDDAGYAPRQNHCAMRIAQNDGPCRADLHKPGVLCMVEESSEAGPTPQQYAATEYLRQNLPTLIHRTTAAVYAIQTDTQATSRHKRRSPHLHQADDSIELRQIFISAVRADQSCVIGFDFDVAWDRTHGVGVLMYDNRIVRVGTASICYTHWAIESALNDDMSLTDFQTA
jgi:hypothetical protein